MRTVDYRPLTDPVDRRALRSSPAGGSTSAATVLGIVIAVIVGGVFLLIGGTVLFSAAAALAGPSGPVIGIAVVLAVIGLIVWAAVAISRRNKIAEHRRITFAEANGMHYWPTGGTPPFQGAIFRASGSSRQIFRQHTGRPVEYANYQYTTGSGKNRTTHYWGYVMVPLDRSLPHMLLDAKANDSVFGSTLPRSFDRDQRLSLEGDFDQHFTLYCPSGYERDALYVFAPDLMALLIDTVAAFDVEVIDDRMFVYHHGTLDLLQPTVWARLFQIVDTVGAKTLAQTRAWTDDRVQAPYDPATAGLVPARLGVAAEGRRLRSGWSVGGTIAVVVGVGIWIAFMFWR